MSGFENVQRLRVEEQPSPAEEQAASCKLIGDFLQAGFDSLDADGTGFVSKEELRDFACAGNGQYRAALAAREIADEIEDLHWEFGGLGRSGFSLADVRQFAAKTGEEPDGLLARKAHYAFLKDEQNSDRFFQIVDDFRGKIDTDKNGEFDKSELRSFIDSGIRNDAVKAAEFLLTRSDEIRKLGSPQCSTFLQAGEFLSHATAHGISETHIRNLQVLRSDTKLFTDAMDSHRKSELYGGAIVGVGGLLAAGMCYSESTFRYGLAKAGWMAGAVVGVGAVAWGAYHVFVNHSKPVVLDYQDQKQRVSSWKYFRS